MQLLRNAVLATVSASLLLITACTGTPTPNPSSSPVTSASASASVTSTPTPSPTPTPSTTPSPSTTTPPAPAQAGVGGKQVDDKTAKQTAAANDALTKLGYSADKDWKTTMTAADWAKVAANNPGYMVQGTSFAKTAQEAAAAAVHNPAVAGTTAEKADPNNWKLVYNNQCMTYPSMAYQDRNGNISWGSGFVECGVAVWVNIASGGSFRLLCDNATNAPPVATQLPPSLPPVTPNPVVVPPVVQHFCKADIPVGDARCEEKPETMQVCIRSSGDQTLRTIDKKDFNPITQSTNIADCVKPPVEVCKYNPELPKNSPDCKPPVEMIKVCIKGSGNQTLVPVKKQDFNPATMSTNPADCVKPPVCVKADHPQPGPGWTWDESKCAWCPPAPPVCVKADHPQPGSDWTWDESKCKWVPPVCVQPTKPGEGWTWDQAHCKWNPPFVCPPGTFPNPSNPKDCMNGKNPADSPPTAPGKDPGTATDDTKTPPVTPISNPISPSTPSTAPAPPVTQTPGTAPTPTTPVSPVEVPAPTSTNKGTGITDPEQPAAATSVAAPAVQHAAPVVAPAPVAKAAPMVVQASAPVVTTPAPATTAPAVHAAAPVGATSAPVATATVAVAHIATTAAPAAHVGG